MRKLRTCRTLVRRGEHRDEAVVQFDLIPVILLELVDTRLCTIRPDAQDIRKQFDSDLFHATGYDSV